MFSAFSVHAKPELGLRLSFTREDDHYPENPSRFLFYARSLFLWMEQAGWKGEPKAALRAKPPPCTLPGSILSAEPEEGVCSKPLCRYDHATCSHRTDLCAVSIRRTRLRIVLVLVAAENDDEDDPEAALPRVYSYNVTTP
jgi:hypothetical protein